jgi:hypothetical protein
LRETAGNAFSGGFEDRPPGLASGEFHRNVTSS